MNNKVVLVNPPVKEKENWVREGRCQQYDIWGAPFPPFSLALISTQLEKAGAETAIIDSGPEKKGIDETIDSCVHFDPGMAILSTTTPTLASDLGWFAARLKEAIPKIKISSFGIHPSALPKEVLHEHTAVDFLFIGEPEITAFELFTCIQKGSDLGQVKGLAFRGQNQEIKINSPREFIENLDVLGFPDWKKINFSNYLLPIKKRPFSLIGFSRGCPFQCKFCATHPYYGTKLRVRTVPSLIEEIKFNLSFGVTDFLFWTEQMALDLSYLDQFLEALLKEGFEKKIHWVCNSRTDSADEEIYKKMRKAGCWQIAFGFEFGDDKILELVKKGGRATVEQGKIAAGAAHRAGIVIDGHFILGYPGETEKTIQKTIDFACSLPLTFAHFYTATPFAGSALFKEAMEKGWLASSSFDDVRQDKVALKTKGLDPALVEKYIRKAYRKFYSRPQVFLRGLRIPQNFREYLNLFKLSLQFYHGILRDF